MTLRIVSGTHEDEALIELHGWLTGGPEIADFLEVCTKTGPPLRIDLVNLAGASADGVLALKEQRARGAILSGASPYIALLLGNPPPAPARRARGGGATG